MKRPLKLLFIILLVLISVACVVPIPSIPTGSPTELPTVQPTKVPPLPTNTPIPTPFPTPTPMPSVEGGDLAFFYGDWDTAIHEYILALETTTDPDIASAALLGIGRTRYMMKDYPAALDSLRQVKQDYPDSPHRATALFILGQIFTELARFDEALDAYEGYLELRPGIIDSFVHEMRGDLYLLVEDQQGAIESFQKAMVSPRLDDPLGIAMKIGQAYQSVGDHTTALITYQDVYSRTTNEYLKAQTNYLMGHSRILIGESETAFQIFNENINQFPYSYYSYLSLVELVDSGQVVDEFQRGLVDYYSGQYAVAIAAFDRYIETSGPASGSALYYKGLSFLSLGDAESAITALEELIQGYPDDPKWADGHEEKAYILWAYLDDFSAAAETLLDFVEENSWHTKSAEFLFDAGRITERMGDYPGAADIWERIPAEYATNNLAYPGLFQSGIAYYRAGDYQSALIQFGSYAGGVPSPGEKAAGQLWIGKCYQALGDPTSAYGAWETAANLDPTGYYSERARDMLLEREPFEPPLVYDIGMDLDRERKEAEAWIRLVFGVPEMVDLQNPGELYEDPRFIRGTEFWNVGLYENARNEFENLRLDISEDPVNNYRLTNYLLDLGLYRSAIFAARQVLNLAGMNDAETMDAPIFFNHIRFGIYYRDMVLPVSDSYDFHPLIILSVMRQESLFEGFIRSSAGARGLMQIIPSTGASIAAQSNWPPNYQDQDLYRSLVSITLGVDYLRSMSDYFDGDLYAALAAYNAGPGNSSVWKDLAGGDPDLFVEIIRFEETRNYIRFISEIFSIYRSIYDRTP